MMWWSGGWAGWLWMSVLMLAFWGGLIWLLITVWQDRQVPDSAPHRPAAEVLAERFARGEIDQAEYAERLRVLQSGPGGAVARMGGTGSSQ